MNPDSNRQPGGFIPQTLPTPPSSSITSPSQNPSTLPHQRAHPLKPGSAKESAFISFVDQGITNITRRYVKRFSAQLDDGPDEDSADPDADAAGRGYEAFGEVARDVEALVDVVWVSGTPSLQISYLLHLASLVDEYLPSFAFAPRPTFGLLRKMDVAFASLLRGEDAETGEGLPGLAGGGWKVSQTEKVRIRGVVERTRVRVVEVAGKGGGGVDGGTQGSAAGDGGLEDGAVSMTEEEEEEEEEEEGDVDMEASGKYASWEMEVARVYERTIVELGESLGG